ncbi:MAG: [FeFe] hydrogenase, group A [Candidatus Adiutrix intracellularis]|jgi:NADH-quinone oxidoreductase subunit G/NADP-reducing hydrogenase subunit HndD|nr:[FeFe] hydrogenase, group A [Candidatus Adiutrix intracellularis]
MSDNVTLTIDGQSVTVPAGVTIWGAARKVGIHIPTLCHHFNLKPYGGCRVCVVEVKGGRALAAACAFPVNEGMVVYTNTSKVREARRLVVELLLANHPHDCLTCDRSQNCELQSLALDLGIKEVRFKETKPHLPIDDSNPSLVRDPNKCVLCGRCVRVCSEKQTVSVYTFANRGFESTVSPAFGKGLGSVKCTYCGQCSVICPTGAITVKDDTEKVMAAINDPDKVVIVQTAPAVRVALGEMFGLEPGSIVTNKMVGALKILGFDRVLDTNFAADLTIMEEATEFLDRFTKKRDIPMITSCSPGWINFLELFYPELTKHHSSCKSPQQMFGAMLKTYYAENQKIDPSKIVSVSIMPCTAKKYEILRPEMRSSGFQDVDYVLTTRELGKLLKSAGISFNDIEPKEYDSIMGVGSGAGTIFGNTGGVMEAALRTAYEVVTKKTLNDLEFTAVRGLTGIREAEIDLGGTKIKVAIAHGLGKARQVMESIKSGNPNKWDFIEVMACSGGCISGGGQPISRDINYRAKRIAGLYQNDRNLKFRKSHENPEIKTAYADYLGEPGGHKSHKLLHTNLIK